ncbi:hypothetical protein EsH8_II_001235 [Colletotrichum jinshuiense]
MNLPKGNPNLVKLAQFVFATQAAASIASQLPNVDLGYAVHQASYDTSGEWYNFSNIHYANAPRFGAPEPVTIVNRTVNNGRQHGICPLAAPAWYALSIAYQTGQLSLDDVNSTFTAVQTLDTTSNSSLIEQYLTDPDPVVTEDCLTLDVVVPKPLWRKPHNGSHSGAPVLVWFYGGGYVLGDKNSAGNPAGLIAKAQEDGSGGVIYVAVNYRLGLFGWASGPDYEEQGGVPNIGLRDQRFALEWIQANIHLFGGDPGNVTVLGESAGGGSVLHQLTAYGSTSGAPFRRAILQSPGFEPVTGPGKKKARFDEVLKWASYFNSSNVSSLDELKQLPFDVMWKVNQITVAATYWGAFGWGPVVDGDFVPDILGALLSQGKFDSSVEVLTGHNSDEGFIFASPLITNDEEYVSSLLKLLLPDASDEVLDYLNTELYPAIYNGTYSWETPLERTAATIADAWFICNNRFLNTALDGNAHSYLFDVAQGWHGTDIAYTFFNNGDSVGGVPLNSSVANTLQLYLTNFAKTGDPNGAGVPFLPKYGDNSTVMSLDRAVPVIDDAATERCTWWQKGLYR